MYRRLLLCLVLCLMAVVVYTRNLSGDDSVLGDWIQIKEEAVQVSFEDFKPLLLDEPAAPEPKFAYSRLVLPAADKYGMDWRLVAAVIQAESGFNPRAVSPMGAVGLMQVMPSTAALYGFSEIELYDPAKNLDVGIRHLKMLHTRYSGDVSLILAAYNCGENAVDRYHGVPPYKATRQFVTRVMHSYRPEEIMAGGGTPILGAAAR